MQQIILGTKRMAQPRLVFLVTCYDDFYNYLLFRYISFLGS
jgi:hypothetical protein